MPVAPSYPGVNVEGVPSGVHTITGVATSIAAFVGYTRKGVADKPVEINSFAQFERDFGGLDLDSPLSYAIHQYFANGGTNAIVLRIGTNFTPAKWTLKKGAAGVLEVTAASPGAWASDVRLAVSHAARNPDAEFNLIVYEREGDGWREVEQFPNLSMSPNSPQFVESIASPRIVVKRTVGLTFSEAGSSVGKLAGAITVNANLDIHGTVDGDPFKLELASAPTDAVTAVAGINAAIATAGLGARLKAEQSLPNGAAGTGAVKLASLTPGENSSVSIATGTPGDIASVLGLGLANGGREFAGHAEHRPAAITDLPPTTNGTAKRGGATDLVGAAAKAGMKALLDVDLFNLLCIPETFDMDTGDAASVAAAAARLCETKRAFYIADAPRTTLLKDVVAWSASATTSRNAAVYFPAVCIADPLDLMRLRAMAPSGSVAGVYARTDGTRGVWKAPAGTDATLVDVHDLAATISDRDNGELNSEGVNALRSFPTYGHVVWGARTRRGANDQTDKYKYVPVRRLALFLEESLYRGTRWVVFEPNDELLWAQIRLNVDGFMLSLFRQGAFQGMSPKDAYFVRCNSETTTQSDINLGIVNILVGFAPLKPAEFVMLKIQQIPGDIPT